MTKKTNLIKTLKTEKPYLFDIDNDDTYILQKNKLEFANTLEKFQSIKNPTQYQSFAYMTMLELQKVELAHVIHNILDLKLYISAVIKKFNFDTTEPIPDIITSRIGEILLTHKNFDDLNDIEKDEIVVNMFKKGNEFYGLYNQDNTINQAWMTNYLTKDDGKNFPQKFNILLTPIMAEACEKIDTRTDITNEEKSKQRAKLFADDGEFAGYLQEDGTTDIYGLENLEDVEKHVHAIFEAGLAEDFGMLTDE